MSERNAAKSLSLIMNLNYTLLVHEVYIYSIVQVYNTFGTQAVGLLEPCKRNATKRLGLSVFYAYRYILSIHKHEDKYCRIQLVYA